MMKEVLLHCCCGPCAIYPVGNLRERGYRVVGFFYNPNIYPEEELSRRREALEAVSRLEGWDVVWEDGSLDAPLFAEKVKAGPRYGVRCKACYRLRLDRTAAKAKELGVPRFSTTLLVSPYQLHEEVRAAGVAAGSEHGVEFLYEDFRPGYRAGRAKAGEYGIYRQKYCGCAWSLEERTSTAGRTTRALRDGQAD